MCELHCLDLTAAPFDEKIEWTWYEVWRHEGRRVR